MQGDFVLTRRLERDRTQARIIEVEQLAGAHLRLGVAEELEQRVVHSHGENGRAGAVVEDSADGVGEGGDFAEHDGREGGMGQAFSDEGGDEALVADDRAIARDGVCAGAVR